MTKEKYWKFFIVDSALSGRHNGMKIYVQGYWGTEFYFLTQWQTVEKNNKIKVHRKIPPDGRHTTLAQLIFLCWDPLQKTQRDWIVLFSLNIETNL